MANSIGKHLAKGLLVVSLTALGITLGCSGHAAQNPQAGASPGMPVKVLEARATPVNDATEYVATVKSRDSTIIMPQVEGQITKINVHSGGRVEAISTIMEINQLKNQATVKSLEDRRAPQSD